MESLFYAPESRFPPSGTSGCVRRFVVVGPAAALDGDELRLIARRAPTITQSFCPSRSVGVVCADDANDFEFE